MRTDTSKLIVSLSNFTKAHKNEFNNGRYIYPTLNMKAVCSSKRVAMRTSNHIQKPYLYWRIRQRPGSSRTAVVTSKTIYHSQRCYIPEGCHLQIWWWSYFEFLHGVVVERSEVSQEQTGSIFRVTEQRPSKLKTYTWQRPTRCTIFLINLYQLNYHIHVSNKIIVHNQKVISVHAAHSILSCIYGASSRYESHRVSG